MGIIPQYNSNISDEFLLHCPRFRAVPLLYLALFRPPSRSSVQYFEEVLACEQAAQDRYYEEEDEEDNTLAAVPEDAEKAEKVREQPEWYDILRSPSSSLRHSRSERIGILLPPRPNSVANCYVGRCSVQRV